MKDNEICVVVDGLTTAMLAYSIFKDKVIDYLIIEEKISRAKTTQWIPNHKEQILIDVLLSELKVRNRYVLTVPCIMYYNLKKVTGILGFYKAKKVILSSLNNYLGKNYREKEYYGAITSSIMGYIKNDNCIYLDHGMEFLQRCSLETKEKKSLLKKMILKFLLKALSLYPCDYKVVSGYTLSNIDGDDFKHISCSSIENENLKLLLNPKKKLCPDDTALFLPFTLHEYESYCFARNIDMLDYEFANAYDEVFKELKNRGISNIYVKFHPGLYADDGDSEYIKKQIEIMCEIGNSYDIKIYHIAELSDSILLSSFPAELLVYYLGIKTIAIQASAAIFNLAEESGIDVLMFIKKMPANFSLLKDDKDITIFNKYVQYL